MNRNLCFWLLKSISTVPKLPKFELTSWRSIITFMLVIRNTRFTKSTGIRFVIKTNATQIDLGTFMFDDNRVHKCKTPLVAGFVDIRR